MEERIQLFVKQPVKQGASSAGSGQGVRMILQGRAQRLAIRRSPDVDRLDARPVNRKRRSLMWAVFRKKDQPQRVTRRFSVNPESILATRAFFGSNPCWEGFMLSQVPNSEEPGAPAYMWSVGHEPPAF
jgi:hypothetical protein